MRVAADYQSLDRAVLALRARAAAVLCEDKLTCFEIAVAEALTNIVQHAYGQKPGQWIEVEYVEDSQSVAIILKDQGKPVPDDLVEAAAALPDAFEESGRGLALIRACSDRIHYTRSANGNALKLEFQQN